MPLGENRPPAGPERRGSVGSTTALARAAVGVQRIGGSLTRHAQFLRGFLDDSQEDIHRFAFCPRYAEPFRGFPSFVRHGRNPASATPVQFLLDLAGIVLYVKHLQFPSTRDVLIEGGLRWRLATYWVE